MSKNSNQPVILIGPVCDDPAESVSLVNQALARAAGGKYEFVYGWANRRFGGNKQGSFNFLNLYYFAKHLLYWVWQLLRHRPLVAHYAVSSGWAMEKGLIFLGLARLLGIKTVGHMHSGDFVEWWNGLASGRRARITREIGKLDGFVVLSEYWRGAVLKCINPMPVPVSVVNNPIEETFENAALQMPVTRVNQTILFMGAVCTTKGVMELVQAAALLKKQGKKLKVILAGPEREDGFFAKIRGVMAAEKLEDTVEIRGSVRGQDKVEVFAEASIFVLPSHFENFPLVVLEAAAAGQALVTTPVGAVPEFFTDGESIAFAKLNDPVDLARALGGLLDHPEQQLKMAERARRVFTEQLSRHHIVSQLERVYNSVLPQSSPSASGKSVIDTTVR